MTEKLGVEAIKKALTALCSVAEVSEEVVMDQGGALSKISHLIKVGDDVVSLLTVDYPKALAELKDLDAVERMDIIAHVAKELDLKHDAVEAGVEKGLAVAVKLGEVVAELIGFAKSLKPVQA